MGDIITIHDLENNKQKISRLLIYQKLINEEMEVISISKVLSEAILKIEPKYRSMRLASCFNETIAPLPDGVAIKGIDALFNPSYQVDVLEILVEARKIKVFSVLWPGKYQNGELIYGEEGFPDYKVFDVGNYDIAFII